MLINKITSGFVIQTYDTTQGRFISQEFIAGDDVDYETDGEPVDPPASMKKTNFPFHMFQPLLTFTPSGVGILSEARKKTYIEHPDRCPYCGSDLNFSEPNKRIGKWIVQEAGCYGCGRSWHDIFVLATIEERPLQ